MGSPKYSVGLSSAVSLGTFGILVRSRRGEQPPLIFKFSRVPPIFTSKITREDTDMWKIPPGEDRKPLQGTLMTNHFLRKSNLQFCSFRFPRCGKIQAGKEEGKEQDSSY